MKNKHLPNADQVSVLTIRVDKRRKQEEIDKAKSELSKLEEDRRKKIEEINKKFTVSINRKKTEIRRKESELEYLLEKELSQADRMKPVNKGNVGNKKLGFWARLFGKNK